MSRPKYHPNKEKKRRNRPPLLKQIYEKKATPPLINKTQLPVRSPLLKHIYKRKPGPPKDKPIITLTLLTPISLTNDKIPHIYGGAILR